MAPGICCIAFQYWFCVSPHSVVSGRQRERVGIPPPPEAQFLHDMFLPGSFTHTKGKPSLSHSSTRGRGLCTSKVAQPCRGWEPRMGGEILNTSVLGLYSDSSCSGSNLSVRIPPWHTPLQHTRKRPPSTNSNIQQNGRVRRPDLLKIFTPPSTFCGMVRPFPNHIRPSSITLAELFKNTEDLGFGNGKTLRGKPIQTDRKGKTPKGQEMGLKLRSRTPIGIRMGLKRPQAHPRIARAGDNPRRKTPNYSGALTFFLAHWLHANPKIFGSGSQTTGDVERAVYSFRILACQTFKRIARSRQPCLVWKGTSVACICGVMAFTPPGIASPKGIQPPSSQPAQTPALPGNLLTTPFNNDWHSHGILVVEKKARTRWSFLHAPNPPPLRTELGHGLCTSWEWVTRVILWILYSKVPEALTRLTFYANFHKNTGLDP